MSMNSMPILFMCAFSADDASLAVPKQAKARHNAVRINFPFFTCYSPIVTVDSPVRPKTSGAYISSACVARWMKTPGVAARRR